MVRPGAGRRTGAAIATLLVLVAAAPGARADVRLPTHDLNGEASLLAVQPALAGDLPIFAARLRLDIDGQRSRFVSRSGVLVWRDPGDDGSAQVTPFGEAGFWLGDFWDRRRLRMALRLEASLRDALLLHSASPRDASAGRVGAALPMHAHAELHHADGHFNGIILTAAVEPRWRWSSDAGSRFDLRGEAGIRYIFPSNVEVAAHATGLWQPSDAEVSSAGAELRLAFHRCEMEGRVRTRYLTAHVCSRTVGLWARGEPLRSSGDVPWAAGLALTQRTDVFWD